jgi:hypothetical protein
MVYFLGPTKISLWAGKVHLLGHLLLLLQVPGHLPAQVLIILLIILDLLALVQALTILALALAQLQTHIYHHIFTLGRKMMAQ